MPADTLPLTVSRLAERAGTSADTIRYYDRLGLLGDVRRNEHGHRVFGPPDVERLRFIHRAQRFGLQLEQIRELLQVRDRGLCPCGHARALLRERADQVALQIRELEALQDDIAHLLREGRTSDGASWPCGDELVQLGDRVPPRP